MEHASLNLKIGKYVCGGIPPAPASKGKVLVIYRVDMDGLLTVTGMPVGIKS